MIDLNYSGPSLRIDRYLAEIYKDYSRTLIADNINQANILVDGKKVKPSYRLTSGDNITGVLVKDKINLGPEKMDLDIIYEDPWIIVVNKDFDLVVHLSSSTKEGTLVNGLLNYTDELSNIGGDERRGIVHRLDKDTTGAILIAKDNLVHEKLEKLFKSRTIKRTYLTIVHGRLSKESGIIDAPIGRSPYNRTRMAVTNENSREALSKYRLIDQVGEYSLVEVELHTGRTHQIRVHMAHIGHPILGDEVYGQRRERIKSDHQMLHANMLEFIHPMTNEQVTFIAPPKEQFREVLRKTGLKLDI